MSAEQGVDMRAAKALFSKELQPGNALREAILQEPDWMPAAEGHPKLKVYMRLLLEQRHNGGKVNG